MKFFTNLIGGLTGAIALNILHQTVKSFDHNAPRVDLVGEEAVTRIAEIASVEPPTGNSLFAATMAGDIVSNALYFSMIGAGKKKHLMLRGTLFGLSAGVGALALTRPLGLSDAPITKTNRTKVMTVAWYVFGGLVTAATIKALRN